MKKRYQALRKSFHRDGKIPNLSALRRPSVGLILHLLNQAAPIAGADWREIVRLSARIGILSEAEAYHATNAIKEIRFFASEWVKLTTVPEDLGSSEWAAARAEIEAQKAGVRS